MALVIGRGSQTLEGWQDEHCHCRWVWIWILRNEKEGFLEMTRGGRRDSAMKSDITVTSRRRYQQDRRRTAEFRTASFDRLVYDTS